MENAQKFKKIFGGILSVGRRKSEDALRSLQALIQVVIIRFVEQNYSGVVSINTFKTVLWMQIQKDRKLLARSESDPEAK
jgi:hypothetical protein